MEILVVERRGKPENPKKKTFGAARTKNRTGTRTSAHTHCLQPNATIAIDVISFFVRRERVDLIFSDGVAFLRIVKIF